MSSVDGAGCCGGSGRNVRWNSGSWLRLRRRKWSAAELTGVMLFIASILLLVIGLLLTVLGFGKQSGYELRMDEGGGGGGGGSTMHHRRHQLLLQIAGPSCLSMTTVIWVAGYIFVRLWKAEQRQHDVSMHELSDRLQLNAVARDLLCRASHSATAPADASSIVLRSPTSLIAYDAQLKRLLFGRQLHHKSAAATAAAAAAGGHRSAELGSRRGSYCSMVVSSKCRPTSLPSSSSTFKGRHLSVDAGNARETHQCSPTPAGSHRSSSVANGSSSIDSKMEDLEHFIIIHSKVSTCSSLSLAGSRSSRTSSSVGSFFWDIQTPAATETADSTSCRRRGSRDLNEARDDSVTGATATAPQAKRESAGSMLEPVSYHPIFHGTTRRNSSSSCTGSRRAPPPGAGDRRPSWTAGTLSPPLTSHAVFRRPPSVSTVHRRQDNVPTCLLTTADTSPYN